MKYRNFLLAHLFGLFLMAGALPSCTSREFITSGSAPSIRTQWHGLQLGSRYHVGLSIYDVEKKKTVFGYKDDNYFVPASCIKILTAYTALRLLQDSLTSGYYKQKDDSLLVWGGGDPGTGYPDIRSLSALIPFLRNADKRIFFSNDHFRSDRFGTGWAWDDYPYAFQCERNAFPLYGNLVWVDRVKDRVTITPGYLKPVFAIKKDTTTLLTRTEWGEAFTYNYDHRSEEEHLHVPVAYLKKDMELSWSEATGQDIHFLDLPFDTTAFKIKGSNRDSLLKIMLQESDNFIAEQLLLASCMEQYGFMDDQHIIGRMRDTYFRALDDDIQWVDGSGLSRYNLVTPRTLVSVLDMIRDLKGMDYIRSVFPAGGRTGNLADWYGVGADQPYVYAKSGTLQNHICLSGYLITKQGKVLIFSFMHNQVMEQSSTVKKAMEKLFHFLYREY